jgi:anthranilate synthase/aminodeoxychorismate synthase-like glutamine amidotransferase
MILILDNYDSFTWNLVQCFGELGAEVLVLRNDDASVDEIRALAPERVVISPGPCTPREAGVSVELIRVLGPSTPILGVCLGHQAIGEAFGGRTVKARRIMHGKTAVVHHTGEGILQGLPEPLTVARYHSLVTDPAALPGDLEVVAWSDPEEFGEEIQGIRHSVYPVWGVQFHPESLFSEGGLELLGNFLSLPGPFRESAPADTDVRKPS